MHKIFWLGVLLVSLLMGCDRVQNVIPEYTENIFPNEEGKYRISFVGDTTYNTSRINSPVSNLYYKREVLGGLEQDLNDREVRRIEVSRSPGSLGTDYEFTFDRLWTQFIQPVEGANYYAERTEDNVRLVKLQFPVFPGVRWNTNLFNTESNLIHTYQTIDTTVTIRGTTYENCVMVLIKPRRKEPFTDEFSYEIYAPDIGMIKKYDRNLLFNESTGDGFNSAESYIYYEEIVEHN